MGQEVLYVCVYVCVFKGGSQSLVSVMVGALPGEVVYSLGQVKWVELKSHAVQKNASEAIFRRNELTSKTYTLHSPFIHLFSILPASE